MWTTVGLVIAVIYGIIRYVVEVFGEKETDEVPPFPIGKKG